MDVESVAFCDDTALVAESAEQLQRLVRIRDKSARDNSAHGQLGPHWTTRPALIRRPSCPCDHRAELSQMASIRMALNVPHCLNVRTRFS